MDNKLENESENRTEKASDENNRYLPHGHDRFHFILRTRVSNC